MFCGYLFLSQLDGNLFHKMVTLSLTCEHSQLPLIGVQWAHYHKPEPVQEKGVFLNNIVNMFLFKGVVGEY